MTLLTRLLAFSLFFICSAQAQTDLPVPIPVNVSIGLDHSLVKFDLQTPFPPMAIFEQPEGWWIVFASPLNLSIPTDLKTKATLIREITVGIQENITIVKIKTSHPFTASIAPGDGLSIMLWTTPKTLKKNTPVFLPTATSSSVHIPFSDAANLIDLEDEESGDFFWIAPTLKPNIYVNEFREFPDFRLLSAIQGMAIQSKREDVECFLHQGHLVLSAIPHLWETEQEKIDQPRHPFSVASIFDKFDPIIAQERREQIDKLMISNPPKTMLSDLLELSWIHLGLGNIPEALSTLKIIEETQKSLRNSSFVTVLKGLAHLLSSRYEKASQYLELHAKQSEPKLWYTLAKSVSQKEKGGVDQNLFSSLKDMQPSLKALPTAIQERLVEQILSTAFATKNMEILETFLHPDWFPKNSYRQGIFNLSKASLLMLKEDKQKDGFSILNQLSTNKRNPQIAAMSQFEILMNQLDKKLIAQEKIIDQLEKLRFQWRGDDLEYRITRQLANLYWSNQNYPQALRLFRHLIEYFPTQSQQDQLAQLMREGLLTYFKKEPKPPLMESLSFFQDFGDLASDSAEGDALMIEATNQLVQLNLHAEAARLLKKHLDKKVKLGNDQAERAAKLIYQIAALLMIDGNDAAALEELKKVKDWPASLKNEPEKLLIKAYLNLNQYDEALKILGDSLEHKALKASIYFQQKKIDEAAQIYETLLKEDYPSDKKAKLINDLALCYALLSKTDSLSQLRTQQIDFMKSRKEESLFDFLTKPDEQKPDNAVLFPLAKAEQTLDVLKKIFEKS